MAVDAFAGFGEFDERDIMLNQADLALSEGQYDVACSYFFKLANESKDKGTVELCQAKIAQCHYRRDRWRDCIESAKASLGNADSKVLLSLSLYHKGDPHAATSLLEEVGDRQLLSDFVRRELETLLPEIQESLVETPATFPKHVEEKVKGLKVQGNYKFKTGDFENATRLYKDAIVVMECWRNSVGTKERYVSSTTVLEQYHKLYGVLLSNLLNSYMKTGNLTDCRKDADTLLEMRPEWKKSYYWSAMTYLSLSQYDDARAHFTQCLTCLNPEPDNIAEQLEFVGFCERNAARLSELTMTKRQEMFGAVRRNVSWLAGNAFAASISKIYSESETHWRMTCSGLVNRGGRITDLTAPKYEASERDRNLMNEMRREEKMKVFIHLQQSKGDNSQIIGFSNTEELPDSAQECLAVFQTEVNNIGQFNVFVKNYLK